MRIENCPFQTIQHCSVRGGHSESDYHQLAEGPGLRVPQPADVQSDVASGEDLSVSRSVKWCLNNVVAANSTVQCSSRNVLGE